MTDEERIIINGIDVSKCEYLTYQLEEDGQYYWFCNIAPVGGPDECEYNPECFYKKVLKQLARKEKELEEYKQSLDEKNKFLQDLGISASGEFKRIKFYIENLKNKYNEKAEECEGLKERLDRTEEDLKYQCVDCMNVKSDRYRKALEEIEEVCMEDTRTFADGTQLRYSSLDEILDIINKVREDIQ